MTQRPTELNYKACVCYVELERRLVMGKLRKSSIINPRDGMTLRDLKGGNEKSQLARTTKSLAFLCLSFGK